MMANSEETEDKTSVKSKNDEEVQVGVVGLDGFCAVCNAKTTLRCLSCVKGGKDGKEIPYYCGKEHQTSHWKSDHKKNCGSKSKQGWEVVKTPGDNCNLPYYKATKDLEPGHVLFTKKPLLVFPKIVPSMEIEVWCNAFPHLASEVRSSTKQKLWNLWTCIGCYELMLYGHVVVDSAQGPRTYKCNECEWPVHTSVVPGQPSSKCQLLHAEECSFFKANGLKFETLLASEGPYLYSFLGLLRAVLLPPELKKELLNLPVFRPELYSTLPDTDKMIRFVRHRCNLGDQVSEIELKKLIMILFSNNLISTSYNSFRKKHVFIIYRGGSTGKILSHDCRPNCFYYLNVETMESTFKTMRKVKKGETLSLNYAAPIIHEPVYERIVMHAVQLFMPRCECRRCNSSDEGGTYLSIVRYSGNKTHKCDMKNLQAYYVPMPNANDQIRNYMDLFYWRCMCGKGEIKQSVVKQLIDKIMGEIRHAEALNDYDGLKSIVCRYSNKENGLVSPTNSAIVFAKITIGILVYNNYVKKTLLVFRREGFKFDLHKKFLADFERALQICEDLQPGRIELKAGFLFGHSLLKISELSEKLTTPASIPTIAELTEELNSIRRNVKESGIIEEQNPFIKPRDKIAESILLKLYANHFESSVKKIKSFAQLSPVIDFCKEYADENVLTFWREWETVCDDWQIFPESELPILLKAIKENPEKIWPGLQKMQDEFKKISTKEK